MDITEPSNKGEMQTRGNESKGSWILRESSLRGTAYLEDGALITLAEVRP
ncbi:hypothetical protein Vi05172_g480 [Venturia inaequalis]|nr:hypothetical protein Vi05172_g480 [Venturia inaequalis]